MIDEPKIVETAVQATAMIRFVIPKDQIQQVMGPAFGELFSTVAQQGVQIVGPAYSYHHKIVPDEWDFEAGVPVAAPITESGRVKNGLLPQATVARTIYRGGYEGLGPAWAELDSWVKSNGHSPRPDLWESYAVGPESGPDPSGWQTELNRPLFG